MTVEANRIPPIHQRRLGIVFRVRTPLVGAVGLVDFRMKGLGGWSRKRTPILEEKSAEVRSISI